MDSGLNLPATASPHYSPPSGSTSQQPLICMFKQLSVVNVTEHIKESDLITQCHPLSEDVCKSAVNQNVARKLLGVREDQGERQFFLTELGKKALTNALGKRPAMDGKEHPAKASSGELGEDDRKAKERQQKVSTFLENFSLRDWQRMTVTQRLSCLSQTYLVLKDEGHFNDFPQLRTLSGYTFQKIGEKVKAVLGHGSANIHARLWEIHQQSLAKHSDNSSRLAITDKTMKQAMMLFGFLHSGRKFSDMRGASIINFVREIDLSVSNDEPMAVRLDKEKVYTELRLLNEGLGIRKSEKLSLALDQELDKGREEKVLASLPYGDGASVNQQLKDALRSRDVDGVINIFQGCNRSLRTSPGFPNISQRVSDFLQKSGKQDFVDQHPSLF